MPPEASPIDHPVGVAADAVTLAGVGHSYRASGSRWSDLRRSGSGEAGSRERGIVALEGIDLTVPAGGALAIVGPSGCGKSTLLRMVAGFLRPSTGRVLLHPGEGHPDDGRGSSVEVSGPGPDRGVVFQQPRLFPWLSVRGNIAFGLRGRPRAERASRVAELLDLVGLADVAALKPYELSGGMQQRAAIARALAPGPRLLLLDEPFAALDALTRERLQDELRALWRRTGTTILLVTHSVDEAAFLGTRIVVLSARPGRIVHREDSTLPYAEQPRTEPEFAATRTRILDAVQNAAAQ